MLRKLSYTILFGHFLLLISCNSSIENAQKYSIGFSQSIDKDLWRESMDHSMEVEASLHPEIKLTISNANRNVKKQIQDVENMIEQNMDVIIIAPYESDSIVPVIEKASTRGIPVIIVDRKVNTSNYTAFLGADNNEIGKIAGKQIVSLSKGRANVLEIRGEAITSPGSERSLGFKQIIEKYPNIKLSILEYDETNSPKSNFQKKLTSNFNIDYVFAFNDIIAYKAWEITKRNFPNNRIKFIGVDGLNGPNGGLQLVKDGVLSGTVLYPTGGSEAIKLALKIINKEIVPKNNKLNTTMIDSLNADMMSSQFDKITIQQSNIEQQQNIIKNQERKYFTQNNLLKLLFFLFVIVLSLALYSIYSRIIISRKKQELEIKNIKIKNQREELKLSNEARLNFFTGLSHEFKTPLTLILSSVEYLESEFNNKGISITKEINLMYNNSRRLLRLINQLLDYRKMEEQKFTLRASKTNIFDFSNRIISDFDREAKKKNIDFSLSTNNSDLEVYLDRNLMDKVYFNILSNAFKFTPEKGKISINIKEDKNKNSVNIYFKDSGIGIPEHELGQVFKTFYQGSNSNWNGSGIGLHLSKIFIELHKGNIEIHSKNGTEFIITLPLGTAHLNEKEIVKNPELEYVYQSDYLDLEVIQRSELKDVEDKYSILYIEDNKDLLDFISDKFSTEYTFFLSDGTDAVAKALELIPDIIICDLNLPEMNGLEVCETLKKDLRTSHIPIIILTASDDQNSYLKALEGGADTFLTKPFNLKVLAQSIKGLLFNREKLRYYYTNNIVNIEDGNFGVSEQDFLKKLNHLIAINIEDSSYTVEDLASDLAISRVQLYRKVKAILGISVSDHINNLRLFEAKELLKKTNLSISEIAYTVGFSTPNYFSASFKNKFGMSPKEFKILYHDSTM
ncbi:substrate-binding domain-containing protein [Flavobacterium sp.]|uniref:hybrid sensor histidine kinase/response regulator transcription factor n=1 Tax=Flavobacterium sp. TaxID=239 RepID=UPI00286F1D4D|nr:substrate-binding domain-containing protein [Flavobacterium sp.]